LGEFRTQSLEEVFSGEIYMKFIEAHKKNELGDYPACLGCERCFLQSAPSITYQNFL